MAFTAIVHAPSNEFITDGSAVVDGVTYILVTLPRNPDEGREKYSGNPADPFLAKTVAEIATYSQRRIHARTDASVKADEDVTALLPALLEHWPEMQAEVTATGTLNTRLWAERITSTIRLTQRTRKGG